MTFVGLTLEDYLFFSWSINSSTKIRATNEQLVDQFVDWSTNRRTNNPLLSPSQSYPYPYNHYHFHNREEELSVHLGGNFVIQRLLDTMSDKAGEYCATNCGGKYDFWDENSLGKPSKKKTTEIVNLVLPLLTPPPPPVIGKKNVGIVVSKFRPPHPLRR